MGEIIQMLGRDGRPMAGLPPGLKEAMVAELARREDEEMRKQQESSQRKRRMLCGTLEEIRNNPFRSFAFAGRQWINLSLALNIFIWVSSRGYPKIEDRLLTLITQHLQQYGDDPKVAEAVSLLEIPEDFVPDIEGVAVLGAAIRVKDFSLEAI